MRAVEKVLSIHRLCYGASSIATMLYGLCVVEGNVVRLVLDSAVIAKAQVRQSCMQLQ